MRGVLAADWDAETDLEEVCGSFNGLRCILFGNVSGVRVVEDNAMEKLEGSVVLHLRASDVMAVRLGCSL